MTELLVKAFSEISKLSENEQDILAYIILDEIKSQRKWEFAFNRSSDLLKSMSDEALKEYHTGGTEPLDPSKL